MGTIAQAITDILGADQVTPWEALDAAWQATVRGAIATDALPDCIAYPTTADELAAIVACAHAHQWRILPCGNGSKLSWGGLLTGADLIISTQRLNQLQEHAVGDLTVTVQPGLRFADLQATLLATRQFLPIDPAYPAQGTLGGIVATRDTGALRQRYGGIRDLLIGVSFVRYDGQRAKAGGRVVKNVAGYDLMKLMTGSFGTLGILTELTFRTYPLPETSQTVLLLGGTQALKAVTAAIRLSSLTPVAMDLLSPGLLSKVDPNTYGLALQFQSIAAGVEAQVALLAQLAAPHGLTPEVLTDDRDRAFWQTLNTTLFPVQRGQAMAIAKLGILPAQAIDLFNHLQNTLTTSSWQARIHANSGIGILQCNSEGNSPASLAKVRSFCEAAGGYVTLLEAPPTWKTQLDPWALPAPTQLLMIRLREQFDPHGCLSPGRWTTLCVPS